jgi:hypothetical protein
MDVGSIVHVEPVEKIKGGCSVRISYRNSADPALNFAKMNATGGWC